MKHMTDEQKKIVEDNHNLIYSFLNKYHLSLDDWYDAAAIGLCQAAMTFDNITSSFSTYAYRCMFNLVYGEMRKDKSKHVIPQDKLVYYQTNVSKQDGENIGELINLIPSNDNVEVEIVNNVIINNAIKKLNSRDKYILFLLMNGYTQTEISKLIGCTKANISRINKKIINILSMS